MITVIIISVDRLVPSRLVWVSSDTLWELAAAEVHSRESGGAEDRDGGEAVNERTVLLMGSKAGVCVCVCVTDFTRKRLYLVTVLSKLTSVYFLGQNVHSPQVLGQVGMMMPGQTRVL